LSEIGRIDAVLPPPSWEPPPLGVFKANWNVTMDCKEKPVDIGVVVRSHEGAVKAAFNVVEKGITDPTATEALAAWKVIQFCNSQGWKHVLFEGDS